jgi:hypothetical protein
MLHRYDLPALIVDGSWRAVEVNRLARALFPGSAAPGWSLMRWVLLDLEARTRLSNWRAVAEAFAVTLQQGLAISPNDAELRAIRSMARMSYSTAPRFSAHGADGQVLAWTSDGGADSVSACLVTVPAGRPELLQITLVPRGARSVPSSVTSDMPAQSGENLLLADLLSCGVCGLLLSGGGQPASYWCVTGCLPALPAGDLEMRVGEAALSRSFPSEVCRKLAIAQEVLIAHGTEMSLNVPVTSRHALSQYERSMAREQRRGMLELALRSVTVLPCGKISDSRDVDLAFAWREHV